MKQFIHVIVGVYIIFGLVSCTKSNDATTPSDTAKENQNTSGTFLTGSVKAAQNRAEIQDLGKKLQEINETISTISKDQTIEKGDTAKEKGDTAKEKGDTAKSLQENKQAIMKEIQSKITAMRQEQELWSKEQTKIQNDFLAENSEAQKKSFTEHTEKITQIDASVKALLKEREAMTNQQTDFIKADSPEGKAMAKIGDDIKKLQLQKLALSKEFQEKNKQLFSERSTKMAEIQKARLEQNAAFSESMKIIQTSLKPKSE